MRQTDPGRRIFIVFIIASFMAGLDFHSLRADGLDKGKGRQTPIKGASRFYAWPSRNASIISSFMKV
jgi:hypothetical protein